MGQQVATAFGGCGPWSSQHGAFDPGRIAAKGGSLKQRDAQKYAPDPTQDDDTNGGGRLPPLPAPPAISPKCAPVPSPAGGPQPSLGTSKPSSPCAEPSMMDVLREAAAKRERAAQEEEAAAALRGQRPASDVGAPKLLCCGGWLNGRRRSPSPEFSELPDGTREVRALTFGDFREEASKRNIGLVAFYYPDRQEPWDVMCGAGFLGNFWHLGPGALELEVQGCRRHFCNAEAAFQALKFWNRAGEFESLSGTAAFKKKRELAGQEDFSYAGFGSNWRGMMAVLRAKFKPGSHMAGMLQLTQDAFLLEHNSVPGRDMVWSDNSDGEGTNWLGMQLMLLRDELFGQRGWTRYIENLVDKETGRPHSNACQEHWQSAVRCACQAVVNAVGEVRDGYGQPTWNGRPREYAGGRPHLN